MRRHAGALPQQDAAATATVHREAASDVRSIGHHARHTDAGVDLLRPCGRGGRLFLVGRRGVGPAGLPRGQQVVAAQRDRGRGAGHGLHLQEPAGGGGRVAVRGKVLDADGGEDGVGRRAHALGRRHVDPGLERGLSLVGRHVGRERAARENAAAMRPVHHETRTRVEAHEGGMVPPSSASLGLGRGALARLQRGVDRRPLFAAVKALVDATREVSRDPALVGGGRRHDEVLRVGRVHVEVDSGRRTVQRCRLGLGQVPRGTPVRRGGDAAGLSQQGIDGAPGMRDDAHEPVVFFGSVVGDGPRGAIVGGLHDVATGDPPGSGFTPGNQVTYQRADATDVRPREAMVGRAVHAARHADRQVHVLACEVAGDVRQAVAHLGDGLDLLLEGDAVVLAAPEAGDGRAGIHELAVARMGRDLAELGVGVAGILGSLTTDRLGLPLLEHAEARAREGDEHTPRVRIRLGSEGLALDDGLARPALASVLAVPDAAHVAQVEVAIPEGGRDRADVVRTRHLAAERQALEQRAALFAVVERAVADRRDVLVGLRVASHPRDVRSERRLGDVAARDDFPGLAAVQTLVQPPVVPAVATRTDEQRVALLGIDHDLAAQVAGLSLVPRVGGQAPRRDVAERRTVVLALVHATVGHDVDDALVLGVERDPHVRFRRARRRAGQDAPRRAAVAGLGDAETMHVREGAVRVRGVRDDAGDAVDGQAFRGGLPRERVALGGGLFVGRVRARRADRPQADETERDGEGRRATPPARQR